MYDTLYNFFLLLFYCSWISFDMYIHPVMFRFSLNRWSWLIQHSFLFFPLSICPSTFFPPLPCSSAGCGGAFVWPHGRPGHQQKTVSQQCHFGWSASPCLVAHHMACLSGFGLWWVGSDHMLPLWASSDWLPMSHWHAGPSSGGTLSPVCTVCPAGACVPLWSL